MEFVKYVCSRTWISGPYHIRRMDDVYALDLLGLLGFFGLLGILGLLGLLGLLDLMHGRPDWMASVDLLGVVI